MSNILQAINSIQSKFFKKLNLHGFVISHIRPRRYTGSRDQSEKAVRQHASSWSRELPCAHGAVPMSGTITSWEHLPNTPQPRINTAHFGDFSLSHFPTALPTESTFSKNIFFKSTVKIPLKILIFRENFFSNFRKEKQVHPLKTNKS